MRVIGLDEFKFERWMFDELTLAGYFSSPESTRPFQILAKNQIAPGRGILLMRRKNSVIFEVCIKIEIKGIYRLKVYTE